MCYKFYGLFLEESTSIEVIKAAFIYTTHIIHDDFLLQLISTNNQFFELVS